MVVVRGLLKTRIREGERPLAGVQSESSPHPPEEAERNVRERIR